MLTPWYVPINHCRRFPMARSASGTTEGTSLRRSVLRGWVRGTCVTPAAAQLSAGDVDRADLYELVVMRKAAELLPIQRAIERDRFGVATS